MGRDKPLVSIVISTWNNKSSPRRLEYFREALESALDQTYPNIEVIVVHDGLDDEETRNLVEEYGQSCLKYFCKPHGGCASTFNYGIRRMKGEWFKWLSDDDMLLPYAIETLLETDKKIVYSDYNRIDENGRLMNVFVEPDFVDWWSFAFHLINNMTGSFCTQLVHQTVFDKVGLFNEPLKTHEDYEWQLRALVKHRIPFDIMHRVTANYRIHKHQFTFFYRTLGWRIWLNKQIRESVLNTLDPELQCQLLNGYKEKYDGSSMVKDISRDLLVGAMKGYIISYLPSKLQYTIRRYWNTRLGKILR